jgi:quinol monooxygenase YgiN
MIALAGHFRVAEGRRAAALSALQTMVAASRQEPGCLHYSFSFDVLDDHCVRVFELFVDADALQAHRDSPHMAAFRAMHDSVGFHGRELAEYQIAGWRQI